MKRRALLFLPIAGALAPALPAAAAAQVPAPKVRLEVTAQQVSRSHGRATAMAGEPWSVRVVLTPYAPNEPVVVRLNRRGRTLLATQVVPQPGPSGRSGIAVVPFTVRRTGRVVVRVAKPATAQLPRMVAKPAVVQIAPMAARAGARGPVVRLLQRQLAALGYVVGRPGVYDDRTARAVLAFRKVTGMARTTVASPGVFRRLARGRGRFRVRFPRHGKHVEADLSLQVLALIRGRRVERIYPMSSGKPSTPTVIGHFRVYRKQPGFNSNGMFMSNYFIRGYAIHGYASVPVFAASHGCLRVPIPDAVSIDRWLRLGDRVDVYP
jgi:lipoprotein-anchoring transpeptidase ErfK/SrfK